MQLAAERANARHGCVSKPLSWDYQGLKIREIQIFLRIKDNDSERYKQAPFLFNAVLSQSRIFTHLEMFELPAPTGNDLNSLAIFDERNTGDSTSLVLDSLDDWEARRQATGIFLESSRRSADITRLTVLSGRTAAPPEDCGWVTQGVRAFPTGGLQWLDAPVYEANSARIDKARTVTKGAPRA
jgi:hypothetical protein